MLFPVLQQNEEEEEENYGSRIYRKVLSYWLLKISYNLLSNSSGDIQLDQLFNHSAETREIYTKLLRKLQWPMGTYVHTYIHTYIHVVYTYTYTYTYTHIYTYTYTYTGTLFNMLQSSILPYIRQFEDTFSDFASIIKGRNYTQSAANMFPPVATPLRCAQGKFTKHFRINKYEFDDNNTCCFYIYIYMYISF